MQSLSSNTALSEEENYVIQEDITETEELWRYCVLESVIAMTKSIAWILSFNLFFGLANNCGAQKWCLHLISLLIGLYSLVTMTKTIGLVVILTSFLSAYPILLIDIYIHKVRSENKIVKIIQKYSLIEDGLVVLLVLFQYVMLDPIVWLEIRGPMMIYTMKLISLANDIKDKKTDNIPNFVEFMGYLGSGANIIFGPWISFRNYTQQINTPTVKNYQWIMGVARAYGLALFFLVVSNCFTEYLINDGSNRLLVGYKEALTYRTSHYFISFLSEAMMLAAGWKNSKAGFDSKQWHFTVTEPWGIEFPSHFAGVVIKWNLPMHAFLKTYVYKKWIQYGRFWAVLMTFIMSSLFHGFEKKVSVVLVSIGLFSYVQILVRTKIQKLLNCCVLVKNCESKRVVCNHKYKTNGAFCKILEYIFSLFTILHLIFVGVLMDPSVDEVGILAKWSHLYFFSWVIILLDLIFLFLL